MKPAGGWKGRHTSPALGEVYADQNERDDAALGNAVNSGRVTAGPALR